MITLRKPASAVRYAALLVTASFLGACGGGSGKPAADSASIPADPPAGSTPTITLTGTPATSVTAGSDYSFQPSVSTSSGTATFSITGQPAWATFNASTGELSGTPTSAEVGTTGDITITASDGDAKASIGPFTIAVTAPAVGTGSASLSWVAPTENIDGSPITGLAGYHIYYGTSADALTQTIDVAESTTTTYVISNLAAGTYYFAVTAYTTQGTESAQSDVASKTM